MQGSHDCCWFYLWLNNKVEIIFKAIRLGWLCKLNQTRITFDTPGTKTFSLRRVMRAHTSVEVTLCLRSVMPRTKGYVWVEFALWMRSAKRAKGYKYVELTLCFYRVTCAKGYACVESTLCVLRVMRGKVMLAYRVNIVCVGWRTYFDSWSFLFNLRYLKKGISSCPKHNVC